MVNIKNFEAGELGDQDLLKILLDHQQALMTKYGTEPVGEKIDTLAGSKDIRMFSKYTVEELAEAFEMFVLNNYKVEGENYLHFVEEVIDSLHFFLEKILISNLNYNKIFQYLNIDGTKFTNFNEMVNTFSVGQFSYVETCLGFRKISYFVNISDNFIRNKERKKEQLPTNRKKFYESVAESVYRYFEVLYSLGITKEEIYNVYIRKNQVNQFRIRSNY